MEHTHTTLLEDLVMRAILNDNNDSYGVQIRDQIEERTGRSESYGTVYSALVSLERKGFVKARMGEATKERGGKRKRFYSVTGNGVNALNAAQAAQHALPIRSLAMA